MKKVIVLILFTFLLIPICEVNAINTFDLPINQNIGISNVTNMYRWYKLKEVDSRNEDIFEHICEYLELKETDYSDWSKEKPEEKYGRIIDEKDIETQTNNLKYDSLLIDNIYSPILRIKEIKLIDENSKEIKYSYAMCDNCRYPTLTKNIYDNDYNTVLEIKYKTIIKIYLDEEISSDIRVQIFFEEGDLLYGFRVSALKDDNIIYQKEENLNTLININSPVYASYVNSKKVSWFSNDKTKYYRYKDQYLVCFEKEYLDGYYENVDDYIKDENQYIKSFEYNVVEPQVIEKEVLKEIIVPQEKIVYKNKVIPKEKIVYRSVETSKDSCEYDIKQSENPKEKEETIENYTNNSKEKLKITKKDIKFFVILLVIMSLITILCMILRELIKKCR